MAIKRICDICGKDILRGEGYVEVRRMMDTQTTLPDMDEWYQVTGEADVCEDCFYENSKHIVV